MPRGVLFDVDGTLVDTTFLHATCWTEALRQHGFVVPASVVHHTIGMSGDNLLDRLLPEDRDEGVDDAVEATRLTLYRQWWGRLSPLPGARELLHACAERGLTVVLASSASEQELGVLREVIDSDDVIAAATSSSDADTGKPAPDLVGAALEAGSLRPEDAVFVGDAKWDGESASKAGVRFVGLTCGGTPAEDLRDAGAIEVWDDPAGLLDGFDRSALAG